MANLKSLAKETAIYGVSSIVGRFLNYLLVPIYTLTLPSSGGAYGVITNMYALIALLLVILTMGLETTFFRFANKEGEEPLKVFSSALQLVGGVSLLFLSVTLLFIQPIADFFGYSEHPWFLGMMLIVVTMDAVQAIPFAYLRYQKRAMKFAGLKLLFILLNIGLNIAYFVFWEGEDVGIAFLINLICSAVVTLALIPELRLYRYVSDKLLLRRMLAYSFPILILGIAGILNQVIDKILFPFVYPDSNEANVQLGIYGATSKIAMIMAMCTQAFRFAYEPFVFGKSREQDNKEMYARAMKFFIIFTLLGFLAVIFYLDVLKYLIGSDYWEGLQVIPIVMMAEIFMGVYFNLSFWYKLTDDTRWGAYFSLTACAVVVVINLLFIPRYGYMACAWAGFTGYAVAMLLSYFVGQRKYPIAYDLKGIGKYVALTASLYLVGMYLPIEHTWLRLGFRSVLLLLFVGYVLKKDLPLHSIPVISRFFRK